MLKQIEKMVGTGGITDGEQITKAGKKVFGKKFIGIYPVVGTKGIPILKEGEVAVLNEQMHWWAVFKKKGKLYEADSFNIDHLKQYADIRQPKQFTQKLNESNCGQRAITNAYFALKK